MVDFPYDFGGYATKNDVECSDGRIIRHGAFRGDNGKQVPLVFAHFHNSLDNVLGYAILEDREDGTYAYCCTNNTVQGQNAKEMVKHGDLKAMSIFANELKQKAKEVIHGSIREVSLVLAGANPGATIDTVVLSHSDGDVVSEDEVVMSNFAPLDNQPLLQKEEIVHAADTNATSDNPDETVAEVFNTLTDKQKTIVYGMIADAVENTNVTEIPQANDVTHSDNVEQGDTVMKMNAFDGNADKEMSGKKTLTHDQFRTILVDAAKCGSMKQAFLAHSVEYGIEDIGYLFPDARNVSSEPALITRQMAWVSDVLSSTNHTPFSRIRSMAADITADQARAKGYVKGAEKKEQIISLLRRVTTPTTFYIKQKLDRDDVVDITDMDVIAWLKRVMRMQLDEELGRALLIGDGREVEHDDKIDETCIRPIWTDDDIYATHVFVDADEDPADIIDACIRSRENYMGSGNPSMYTTTKTLTDMLLLKDNNGRRLYANQAELETTLRVSKIVEVPVMTGATRDTTVDGVPATTVNLLAIIVNLRDYTIGADKGGSIGMFDDFDIDFNQYKFLMESRGSGALTLPKSAIVIEQLAE
jgi:HK97 family phage prohead protease/HK97 family phage major capsid protein